MVFLCCSCRACSLNQRIIQQMHFVGHHLWHTSTTTCFGSEVPSSGSHYTTNVYKPTCHCVFRSSLNWSKSCNADQQSAPLLIKFKKGAFCWSTLCDYVTMHGTGNIKKFDRGHPVVVILTNNIQYFSSDTTRLYIHKNVITGLLVSVSQNHLSGPQY